MPPRPRWPRRCATLDDERPAGCPARASSHRAGRPPRWAGGSRGDSISRSGGLVMSWRKFLIIPRLVARASAARRADPARAWDLFWSRVRRTGAGERRALGSGQRGGDPGDRADREHLGRPCPSSTSAAGTGGTPARWRPASRGRSASTCLPGGDAEGAGRGARARDGARDRLPGRRHEPGRRREGARGLHRPDERVTCAACSTSTAQRRSGDERRTCAICSATGARSTSSRPTSRATRSRTSSTRAPPPARSPSRCASASPAAMRPPAHFSEREVDALFPPALGAPRGRADGAPHAPDAQPRAGGARRADGLLRGARPR